MLNMNIYLLAPLLFLLWPRLSRVWQQRCLKTGKLLAFAALFFGFSSLLSVHGALAADGLFGELTDKGTEVFHGMRDIIYVVAGFGIIGVAVGGFFGTLNWKWLGAIIIGLVIIAATGAFINYIVGEKIVEIEDTLK